MTTPRFILIGGFLGAGKTTALTRLATHLRRAGQRVGLITNDQSVNLVDTARVQAARLPVREITGGCFCCQFAALVDASEQLNRDCGPDVILAEPVGSCTDVKATVGYPLRQIHGGSYDVAPLSVLVDPQRCAAVLHVDGATPPALGFDAKVDYIYRKQLEEAEIIVLNKVDLLTPDERGRLQDALAHEFPAARVLAVSHQTGAGLEVWYDAILSGALGRTPAMDVDYDVYADGEALMGWVNVRATLHAAAPFDGNAWLLALGRQVRDRLAATPTPIAHLKMTLTDGANSPTLAAVSLTDIAQAPRLTDRLPDLLRAGGLLINLRAEADPKLLENEIRAVCAAAGSVSITIEDAAAFRPGRPSPTHRVRQPV